MLIFIIIQSNGYNLLKPSRWIIFLYPKVILLSLINVITSVYNIYTLEISSPLVYIPAKLIEPVFILALEKIICKHTLSFSTFFAIFTICYGLLFFIPTYHLTINIFSFVSQMFHCNFVNFLVALKNIFFLHINKSLVNDSTLLWEIYTVISVIIYMVYFCVFTILFGFHLLQWEYSLRSLAFKHILIIAVTSVIQYYNNVYIHGIISFDKSNLSLYLFKTVLRIFTVVIGSFYMEKIIPTDEIIYGIGFVCVGAMIYIS
tara:strand:+ start:1 stop:780 length:780 start_codon:yes stop_codon:yes gene_type:complete